MEKILLAINPNRFNAVSPVNNTVLDFAAFIAKLNHSKLTGIFLEEDIQEPATANYRQQRMQEVATEDIPYTNSKSSVKESIQKFEDACSTMGVRCSIHYDKGSPVEELIKETRFSDMLILDAELSFSDKPENTPTDFARDILQKSECPVIVAPYSFHGIDEIVFAYDGSASAVFAIKQFTYLFPCYRDKKITVLQVSGHDDQPVIAEKERISEFLQQHYPHTRFEHMQGAATNELFSYLIGKKNIFLVIGAFGRSSFSDFFRHSTAEILVKTINHPLFIAHC